MAGGLPTGPDVRLAGDSGGILLRRADARDAGRVAALSGQLGYPAAEEAIRERLRAIGQRADHAVFVAEAEGRGVGWVHVYAVMTVESRAHAEIGGLVVDEAHRGRGIGRALMERAEAWAWDMGLAAVRLRSNVIRAEAHAFYARIGYAPVKTQKVFAKELREET